jgi:hypothetical protein
MSIEEGDLLLKGTDLISIPPTTLAAGASIPPPPASGGPVAPKAQETDVNKSTSVLSIPLSTPSSPSFGILPKSTVLASSSPGILPLTGRPWFLPLKGEVERGETELKQSYEGKIDDDYLASEHEVDGKDIYSSHPAFR